MTTDGQHAQLTRRSFGKGLTVAVAATAIPQAVLAAIPSGTGKHKICAFIKFLQELNYEQLADAIKEIGFDGVEVTARVKEGYIHPDAARDELPKLQEVLRSRDLDITILTTEILGVDEPHTRPLLKTAAALKIPFYRMGFYRYDLSKPLLPQLAALHPKVKALAELNRKLGIAGVYQNHCGADFFSATIWDLHSIIKDYPTSDMGCVFDIRHASVEAGEAWPQLFNLIKPHISAISVKDYDWNGPKSKHVPLGQGRVDYPKYLKMLGDSGFAGPISLHVEYLPQGSVVENLDALRNDFATLKNLLAA